MAELTPIPATNTPDVMVAKLTDALAANPVGVVSISVDGQTVTYSRSQALAELTFWERRTATRAAKRPRAATIDLSRGFIR
jgi:hypothetical protein